MFGVLDRDDTLRGGLIQTQLAGPLGPCNRYVGTYLLAALFPDLSAPGRPSVEVVRGQFPV